MSDGDSTEMRVLCPAVCCCGGTGAGDVETARSGPGDLQPQREALRLDMCTKCTLNSSARDARNKDVVERLCTDMGCSEPVARTGNGNGKTFSMTELHLLIQRHLTTRTS